MTILEVSNVSKSYRVFYEKNSLVKNFSAWWKGRRIYEDIWALKDINFALEKGETIGVIGKNGAGKSTLLKLLAGVTREDRGSIRTNGFVSALLELGTGFHEELTGRENVFLNGAILGMKKREIQSKFDNIVAFADIGKFIDSPMRTYSTGMWMRLGFALAINANFEILLIDEILAVGDVFFQKKCFEKFAQLKDEGVTILFVSHDLEKVRDICNRTIWLERGRVEAFGGTEDTLGKYINKAEEDGNKAVLGKADELRMKDLLKKKWGSKEIEILKVYFTDKDDNIRQSFTTEESLTVNIRYSAKKLIKNPTFGFGIYSKDGQHICGPNTKAYNFFVDYTQGEGEIKFLFENLQLLEGEYLVSISVYDEDIYHPYDHHEQVYGFSVEPNKREEKYGFLKPAGRWRHERR